MLADVDAVLFDLDGTLIDSSNAICRSFNQALIKHDLKPLPDERVKATIGRPLRELFAEQAPEIPIDGLVSEYKKAFSALAPGSVRLLPGVLEWLPVLSRQKKLGIVTSRTSAGTSVLLDDLELRTYFSVLVGIEDVKRPKPDPDPVLMALRELEVCAKKSLFVGDTIYDMEAGSRAGTRTVGITSGCHDKEQLLTAGADFVVEDLITLQELIGG